MLPEFQADVAKFDFLVAGQIAHMDCSDDTAAIVDKAVQKLLREAYAAAKQLLSDNRSLLDEISEHLLLKETISGEELMAFVHADKTPAIEEAAEAPAIEEAAEVPAPEEAPVEEAAEEAE